MSSWRGKFGKGNSTKLTKKAPKKRSEKSRYTIYYPHSRPASERVWDQPYYQFLSIDPGIKNLGVRFERRYHIGLIETLHMESYSFTVTRVVPQDESTITVCTVYEEINIVLRELKDLILGCHFIVIEEQMNSNRDMIRIAQHLISTLSLMIHDTPMLAVILEMDSHLKTRELGAPPKMSKPERKKWTVEYALAAARARNDTYTINKILNTKKRDEFGDTTCMIEALCRLWKIK